MTHTMSSMKKYSRKAEFWLTKMSSYTNFLNKELRSILAAILFFSPIFLFNSCGNDDLTGVPADAGVKAVGVYESDTFRLNCNTVFESPLRTEGINTALLGYSGDNDSLSQSIYSFASEFSLPSGAINLPRIDNPQVVSFKLYLSFADFYGDYDQNMEILAYLLSERLDSGAYLSNEISRLNFNENNPHRRVIKPDPINPIQVNGNEESPALIIDLPNDWGQQIIANPATSLASNEAFRRIFPGLYISAGKSQNNGGGIGLLNLSSESTRLILEFQDDFYADPALNPQFTLEFPIDENSRRVAFFEHLWTPLVKDRVSAGGDANYYYVQSAAGLKTTIKIPALDTWKKDENIVVQEAILFLPAASEDSDNYPNHERMYLITQSAEGLAQFIPDIFRSVGSYGGVYNPITNAYQFNILQYVQGIIDGRFANNGLQLIDAGGYFGRVYNPRRTQLLRPDAGERKMNFRISYSIY